MRELSAVNSVGTSGLINSEPILMLLLLIDFILSLILIISNLCFISSILSTEDDFSRLLERVFLILLGMVSSLLSILIEFLITEVSFVGKVCELILKFLWIPPLLFLCSLLLEIDLTLELFWLDGNCKYELELSR